MFLMVVWFAVGLRCVPMSCGALCVVLLVFVGSSFRLPRLPVVSERKLESRSFHGDDGLFTPSSLSCLRSNSACVSVALSVIVCYQFCASLGCSQCCHHGGS